MEYGVEVSPQAKESIILYNSSLCNCNIFYLHFGMLIRNLNLPNQWVVLLGWAKGAAWPSTSNIKYYCNDNMYTVYIGFTKSKSSFVWPNQRTWSNSEVVQRDFTPYSLQLISLISWDCRHFSISFIFQLGPAFCSLFFCVCLPTRFLVLFFVSLLFLPLFSHVLFPCLQELR